MVSSCKGGLELKETLTSLVKTLEKSKKWHYFIKKINLKKSKCTFSVEALKEISIPKKHPSW